MPTLLHPHALPYAGLSVLVAVALAGCGGGSSTTNGPAPVAGSTPAPSGTAGAGNGQGQRQPGTTGLIAAVNGSTMQVQTRTDQTAVTWTDGTSFSQQVVATLADVTTGSCVTVVEPAATGSATATPGTTAAPTAVTAATVQVRPATNGQCTGGFGGGAGGGGAAPTGAPSGARTRTGTAWPDGTGGAGGQFGRRPTNGIVTAVSGNTITVQEATRGGGAGAAPSGSTPSTTGSAGGSGTGATQTVTVTTTGSTAYVAEKPASASDVVVGECATATGKADDTGAVAATAVALRPAANGSCPTGGTGRPTGSATGSATSGSANG